MAGPSRIIVGATQVPFVTGGAEWHAEALDAELRRGGFRSELVRLPFRWDPRTEVLRSALAWRMLDMSRAAGDDVDLYIGTRFPSYVAPHPNKIVWLFHQFRQAYDLHDAGVDGFPKTDEGTTLRAHVMELDTLALKECRRIFTTSRNNARRLHEYNGLEAEVLPLPLMDPASWYTEPAEGYVLSVGRLDELKRTALLIRALKHMPPSARAVIVGDGPERSRLAALTEELDVAHRVRFAGRVEAKTLKQLYARASVVFYAPWDEDYGLVTIEAMHARKPVVTTSDAGGPLEFVDHGQTGLVVESEPEEIAGGIARLLNRPGLAARLGEQGYERVSGLRWENVIERLTNGLG